VLETLEEMGTGYLAGWLVGTVFMWKAGFVDNLWGTVYTIVGLLALFEKIRRSI
jgi:hypothetical protein